MPESTERQTPEWGHDLSDTLAFWLRYKKLLSHFARLSLPLSSESIPPFMRKGYTRVVIDVNDAKANAKRPSGQIIVPGHPRNPPKDDRLLVPLAIACHEKYSDIQPPGAPFFPLDHLPRDVLKLFQEFIHKPPAPSFLSLLLDGLPKMFFLPKAK